MTAITGVPGKPAFGFLGWDDGDRRAARPTTLCLRPSAIDPPPHKRFVENKSRTPIRPSGDRTVEALISRFSGLQSGSISALFSRFFTVRSAEGRNALKRCAAQDSLIAGCQRSSNFHPLGLSYSSGFLLTKQVRNGTLQIFCQMLAWAFSQARLEVSSSGSI